MGLLGKIKGFVRKNKKQANTAIDKASDAIEKKVGEEHAAKVEAGAEKVKDVIEKLDGDEPGPSDGSPAQASPGQEP